MKRFFLLLLALPALLFAQSPDLPAGSNYVTAGGYINGLNYVHNLTPTSLPAFRKKLAQARDNVANCRVLVISDSTGYGYGGTDANVSNNNSWVTRFITILNSRLGGVTVQQGLFVPPKSPSTDTRWAVGTGWALAGLGGFGFGNSPNYSNSVSNTAPSGNLVLTPGVTFDRADVYYAQTGSGATVSFNSTGASPATKSTAGSSGTAKTTVSITSGTTFSITGTADSKNSYILGIECYVNATKRVLVGNASVHGTKTSDWAASGNWQSIQAVQAYAPDLAIICLGINDAGSSVSTATYIANLQTIITACKASGDVILMTMPPSTGATYVSYENLYVPALKVLSAQQSVPLVDIWGRWGGVQPSGFYYDALHPNNTGYWDIGQFMATVLTSI